MPFLIGFIENQQGGALGEVDLWAKAALEPLLSLVCLTLIIVVNWWKNDFIVISVMDIDCLFVNLVTDV